MPRIPGSRPPWLRLLLSAAWPMVIPLALWFVQIREIRAHLWTPDSRALPGAIERLTQRFILVFALPQAGICFALGVITCLVIYGHQGRLRLAARVAMDLLLILSFMLAPWAASLVVRRPVNPGVLDTWLGPGVAFRAIPCFCAVLAAATYLLTARDRVQAHEKTAA